MGLSFIYVSRARGSWSKWKSPESVPCLCLNPCYCIWESLLHFCSDTELFNAGGRLAPSLKTYLTHFTDGKTAFKGEETMSLSVSGRTWDQPSPFWLWSQYPVRPCPLLDSRVSAVLSKKQNENKTMWFCVFIWLAFQLNYLTTFPLTLMCFPKVSIISH